jgi:hypothetical protein
VLTVHTRHGVTEVLLTGDAVADEILRRFAARGGCVIERRDATESESDG